MLYGTLVLIVTVVVAGIIGCVGRSSSASALVNIMGCVLGALSSLAVAAFGTFGFLASYELTAPERLPWQIGYGLLVIGAVVTAARIAARCGRRSKQ